MKKIILVSLIVVSTVAGVFAASYSNTWSWSTTDEKVNFFRYQLESQDNEWTVVDKTQTQVTFDDMDDSIHTLYVQMSYDGENWGPSSSSSTEIQEKAVAKVSEKQIEEKEVEVIPDTESEIVAEKKDLIVITLSPVVSLDVNDVWWPSNFGFGTSFGGEIGFDFYQKDSRLGWGYLLGAVYSPSLVLESGDPATTALTAKLGLDISVRLGEMKKWSVALNGGITSSWDKDAVLGSNFSNPVFGVFGGVGVRYAVLKHLSLGMLLNYNRHF